MDKQRGVADSLDGGEVVKPCTAKDKALEIFGTDDPDVIGGMLTNIKISIYPPLSNPVTVTEGNTADGRWKVYLLSQSFHYCARKEMMIVDIETGEKFK